MPASRGDRRQRRPLPQDERPRGVPPRRAHRRRVGHRTRCERGGMSVDDITWFAPHQANVRIIEAAANRLGIPMERTLVNIDRYGNTSAASIPLVLAEAADDGRLQPTATSCCCRASAPGSPGAAHCCAGASMRERGVSAPESPGSGRVRHRRVAWHRPRRSPSRSATPAVGSRSATRPTSRAPRRPRPTVEATGAEVLGGAGRRRRPRVGRPGVPRDRGDVRPGRAAREQRRHHPRRPADADERRALGRRAPDQPHRRLPHHPPGDAEDDEGPLRPHRQRVVGERPDRPGRAGQLLGGQGRARRASPGPSPGSWRAGASPATSWPPGLS